MQNVFTWHRLPSKLTFIEINYTLKPRIPTIKSHTQLCVFHAIRAFDELKRYLDRGELRLLIDLLLTSKTFSSKKLNLMNSRKNKRQKTVTASALNVFTSRRKSLRVSPDAVCSCLLVFFLPQQHEIGEDFIFMLRKAVKIDLNALESIISLFFPFDHLRYCSL